MNKLEKIELEAQKAREKIAAMQAILKQIDGKRTEQENLQIVQQVRALRLSREELYAFLNGGALPAALTEQTEPTVEPETIYSQPRRERTRHHEPDATAPDTDNDTTNFESEGIKNEE